MSSKNILYLDKSSYIQKNERRLLRLSDAYFYDKHFLLGQGVNRDEMIFSTIFNAFLYEKNCELNNLIQDKISGKFEPEIRRKNPIIPASEDGERKEALTDIYWDKIVEW